MAPQHAYLSPHDSMFSVSVPDATPTRDHLTLVPSHAVFLTYADDVELLSTGPIWRRVKRRFPAGLIHAAEPRSSTALCGTPLESLEAFGRSRYPFECFDGPERCPRCDALAGRPTA